MDNLLAPKLLASFFCWFSYFLFLLFAYNNFCAFSHFSSPDIYFFNLLNYLLSSLSFFASHLRLSPGSKVNRVTRCGTRQTRWKISTVSFSLEQDSEFPLVFLESFHCARANNCIKSQAPRRYSLWSRWLACAETVFSWHACLIELPHYLAIDAQARGNTTAVYTLRPLFHRS